MLPRSSRHRTLWSAPLLLGLGALLAGCAPGPVMRDPTGIQLMDRFLTFIANPNVVYLLFVLGLLAVIAEISTPGAVGPGVAGVLMLLLSLYGLLQLPTNWLGPVLIIAGVAMLLIDIKVTGIALSIGGIAAFLVGSLLMFTPPWADLPMTAVAAARLNPWLIGATTLGVGLFFLLGVAAAFRAQLSPLAMGRELVIGKAGLARQALDPYGIVNIEGEEWTAEAPEGEVIPAGARIRVVALDGLRLRVERAGSDSEGGVFNG